MRFQWVSKTYESTDVYKALEHVQTESCVRGVDIMPVFEVHTKTESHRPSYGGAMFYNGALWCLFWEETESKSQAINLVKARMVRENLHIDKVFVRSVHKDLAARDKYLKKIGKQMKEAVEKGQPIDNPLYAWYEKRIKPVPRPIPIPPPQTDQGKTHR